MFAFATILLLVACLAAAAPQRRLDHAPPQSWGNGPVRGVNIGGWLVLEPWITPSLFTGKPDWVKDEATYARYQLGQPQPYGEIGRHWDTWITYDDFAKIADSGLNTVRIPVGFWSLVPLVEGEVFMVGAFNHLKRAVGWAKSVGLQVMLDLHGAPGGQNTWDNSGQLGVIKWYDNNVNMDRTSAALNVLMREFNRAEWAGTVTSVCVLNEPNPHLSKAPAPIDFLKTFYRAAYSLIRDQSPATPAGGGIVVIISEAYQSLDYWKGFMRSPQYTRVALDWHSYHVFEDRTLALSFDDHIAEYCALVPQLVNSDDNLWTVVGEFTAAPTDCGGWAYTGSPIRWNPGMGEQMANPNECAAISGKPDTWTPAYRDYLTRSWETQTWVYEKAQGWVAWCWKAEKALDWSLEAYFDGGWLTRPRDLASGNRKFGMPCRSNSFENTFKGVSSASRCTAVPGIALLAGGAALMMI
ncbi:hypothetical protein CcaverHIS002_0110870 [Cutaneotrichosporon cavernicola]|uniref:Glycoside hydrolase family 5 domain-containing protein n=1 Tax=Cutaneotrichosporon cavernicola TaxID=279322 RepID=A0AA48HZD7_9TREE|nr:uncharacterized protein CcaverHIS019_0110770 [Cutaneotrichosporon cavernicola]BEI80558.1 hypothetical protein CcaverHIS002_0110870 [Cutaneotrichosporon cavernicola]BEI88359.1 hypothetical protein CcaverHIS019_0110770 [Cutaneotrichosporon cavernicola]BEI96132.1 hypothetical protein CcaverHIS631_0110810 [Cutaneotrichosporon cavernicola]BEJ03904.1 hypothetical protein CcaverHIS641_0110790 [Cutaneotrichosporon cavernicola]